MQTMRSGGRLSGVLCAAARLTAAAGILAVSIPLVAGVSSAQEGSALQTDRDKVMYSLGVNLASNLRAQGVEVNLDTLVLGMQDVLAGKPLLLPDEEIRIIIQKYQAGLRKKQSEGIVNLAAANKREGESFLAANKSAAGVVPLPSGLQYLVVKAGSGRTPTDADTVQVKLRGTLPGGRVFEKPPAGGASAKLKVAGTVPGLAEALKMMPVGSVWKVFVPPQLGYGERGKPPAVGPYATLIYEVELVGIE